MLQVVARAEIYEYHPAPMDPQELKKLLQGVSDKTTTLEQAMQRLLRLPFSDLGYARVDHHRKIRQGMPEVVFGEHKTAEQLIGIVSALRDAGDNVLVTRVEPDKARLVCAAHPELSHGELGRTLSLTNKSNPDPFDLPVAIVTAGTSDQFVAEEAAATLHLAGARVERFYDIGVAGIHRLFEALPKIERAPAIICIAGMEGALPSVIAGLVRVPVIAVPTSVGYGVALNGFTALLGMLTACASGVSVVNIDNGFGAAMAVLRLAHLQQPNPGVDP